MNLEISTEINNNNSLLEEPFSRPKALEFVNMTNPNEKDTSLSKIEVSKELVCLNDVEESNTTISSLSPESDIRPSYAILENKLDITDSFDFQYLLNILVREKILKWQ